MDVEVAVVHEDVGPEDIEDEGQRRVVIEELEEGGVAAAEGEEVERDALGGTLVGVDGVDRRREAPDLVGGQGVLQEYVAVALEPFSVRGVEPGA
jgi:hypothetical protein